jgi:hypothetical protein
MPPFYRRQRRDFLPARVHISPFFCIQKVTVSCPKCLKFFPQFYPYIALNQ